MPIAVALHNNIPVLLEDFIEGRFASHNPLPHYTAF